MPEPMERVMSTRILFESALQDYIDACSALRKSCMAGELPLAEVENFTSNELAFFTSHGGKLQTAKALLGNVQNYTKPVGSLPSEILSRIFHLVPLEPLTEPESSNYFRFPTRLESISHTCSRWRQAALDTPSLWTFLCFAPHIVINRGLISRATVYAARAGGLPLEIDITEYKSHWDSTSVTQRPMEEDPLPEFLALIAHQISSVKLYAPLWGSRPRDKVLEACLAGATPGILTQLDIVQSSSTVYTAIESSHDSSGALGMAVDIPVQRLEDILSFVTSLSLRYDRFPWTSKAFHGLVKLQLIFNANSGVDYSGVKISESDLFGILSSSPGLQRFLLRMPIQESGSSDDPRTSVALEDLEVLDLRGLDPTHLAAVLQLVAPGSRLSMVWLTLPDTDLWDPRLYEALKSFFDRANTPNLGLTFSCSLSWLETLRGLVNNLSVLVMQSVKFSDDPPVIQQGGTPTALNFVDRLDLYHCTSPLTPLSWVLDAWRPRILTLWNCYYEYPKNYQTPYYMPKEEALPMLSQECPYVDILENDEPDPVWDRG